MNPPVRMVCGSCLRSVEVSPDDLNEASARCPFCGELIDRQSDPYRSDCDSGGSKTEDLQRKTGESGLEVTPDWTTAWSRGSLGSLGRFQIRERLGDGGFGHVFLAFDPRLDRDVALKVLKEPNPSERVMERFFREARAAARLDHPNIVAVYDAGFDEGCCWVAYQYVSGRPLWWYRDHNRMDPPTAARILRELADAVDHAHRLGVLHRDIKPANILIDDLGRPRLIDFGLARRSDLDSSLTRDGAIVGTPAYMSPEQALGFNRRVDERSDVYSLGVILFEMLCGQRPFQPQTESYSSDSRSSSDSSEPFTYPTARSINPAIPSELDRICMRAIAIKPETRYPTARALADDLDHWLRRHQGQESRLSFTLTCVVLGLAAMLLLVIGLQAALLPWSKSARPAAVPNPEPAASATILPPRVDSSPSSGPAKSRRKSGSQATSPTTPKEKIQFVGNKDTRKYHVSTCQDLSNVLERNRVVLKSVEEAQANGFQPCGHCRPSSGVSRTSDSAQSQE